TARTFPKPDQRNPGLLPDLVVHFIVDALAVSIDSRRRPFQPVGQLYNCFGASGYDWRGSRETGFMNKKRGKTGITPRTKAEWVSLIISIALLAGVVAVVIAL